VPHTASINPDATRHLNGQPTRQTRFSTARLPRHEPNRHELALEKLEVFDESLMMPIALVHQRDQWPGVNENSLPCQLGTHSRRIESTATTNPH